MGDELSVIARHFKRVRSKAMINLAVGLAVTAMLIVYPGTLPASRIITMILLGLNVLGNLSLARRVYRLWPSGPVMTALRDRPQDIASIHQWPAKIPPGQQPWAVEIRTKSGALASVILDRKQPGDSAALVAALRMRAPDAVVVYPAGSVA